VLGLLAVQAGLLSREALGAGLDAWARDTCRSLGRLIEAQGALSGARRRLLEALVREHLGRHGDDPARSLAALGWPGPTQADPGPMTDPDRRADLARADLARTAAGDVGAEGPPTAARSRFRILRPHARGGLGEVYVARDDELRREVALKVIQARYARDPDSRARFLAEAEITGKLEHPGVVPVYGLGQDPDGRPFYAMRFVRGETLKEAITRFHNADAPGRDPGERALALRQLLGRFLDACNAIAFAHSRGVLHRDLKPDNILLGPYGETLVVDWGLAKLAGRPGGAARAGDEAPGPEMPQACDATLPGSPIGTPAYMSPEQAAGRLDLLGPASDVYGLGATLYCFLAGRAPFEGHSVESVMQQVRRGEFPPPRAASRMVDPALEAICLKAMTRDVKDRYPSPRALADDLEHWLADEPISARREPTTTRLARWARRHKPLVTGMVATLIVAVTALSVGAVLIGRQKARAVAQSVEAGRQRRRAEGNLGLARQVVDEMYRKVAESLADQKQMDEYQREILEKALLFYEGFALPQSGDPDIRFEAGRAGIRAGEIRARLGRVTEAESAYLRALGVLWSLGSEHPAKAEYRRALADGYHGLGSLYHNYLTGRAAEAERSYRWALEIRQRLADDHPEVADYRRAVAASFNNLGNLFRVTAGRMAEAEQSYRQALEIRQRLAGDHPEGVDYQSELATTLCNLGLLYNVTGRKAEAEATYERALGIQQKLTDEHPRTSEYQIRFALTLSNLGVVYHYYSAGRMAEAERAYRRALEIRQKLADDHPEVAGYQSDLSFAYSNLGVLLYDAGRWPEAERAYRRALEIHQRLADAHPEVADYRNELANALDNLAVLSGDAGALAEAEALFRQALSIQQDLAGDHPEQLEFAFDLGVSAADMGRFLRNKGDDSSSCDRYTLAIRTLGEVLQREPRHSGARRTLREAYEGRARALTGQGDHSAALDDWDRAIELAGKDADRSRLGRAATLARLGDHAHALAEVTTDITISERDLYDAACDYALLSVSALGEAGRPPAEREAAAERLTSRAVGLLCRARDAGPIDDVDPLRSRLEKDPGLDPLRSRRDFRDLIDDLTFPAEPFQRSR
jgi:serine/threonine-protein kinase